MEPSAYLQNEKMPDLTNTVLSALSKAWITAMASITLLIVAVELSRFWDAAIYFRALQAALAGNA